MTEEMSKEKKRPTEKYTEKLNNNSINDGLQTLFKKDIASRRSTPKIEPGDN